MPSNPYTRPNRVMTVGAIAYARRVVVVLAVALLGLSMVYAIGGAPKAVAQGQTVVSLTFDDGYADNMNALPILNQHGMNGTFYVTTGPVGTAGHLTRANLDSLAASGNEIAGHTVTHPDLTTVPADEARRQICNSRATLTSWGFPQTSFAYPYATHNSQLEDIVAECGYNSARTLGDLQTRFGCPGCPYAGPIPPTNPYNVPAPAQQDGNWTLDDLKSAVTNAEGSGGGWVPLTFHHVCDNCGSLAISPALLDQFLSWLAQRGSLGTTVKTVDDVVGGAVQPVVTVPPATNTELVNTSLEDSTGGSGFPDCWMATGWGTNTATWTRTTDAHTGQAAQRLDVTGYSDGDAKLMPTLDTGACSPAGTPGQSYELGTWYKSDAITQFAVYYRTASGAWTYWTSSPWFGPATNWTEAKWTTPELPPEAVGVSFGLAPIGNGTLTTDDYSFAQASPPPVNTALSNTSLEEATGGSGFPDCWMPGGWGANTPTWTRTADAHSGQAAQRLDITGHVDGDAKLLPSWDAAGCTPAITPGQSYDLGTWYKANGTSQFALYYRTVSGNWTYWTSSPWFGSAADWTEATWTTPPAPTDAAAISFGLALIGNGTLTTDDYSFAAGG
ncbi:MAG: polysaccharide deacetylase family protein [Pseudonocardiaceae bacterium]|nr:polysaccharide deacetylase family protein [Pseudonocardiaceae bacterium]